MALSPIAMTGSGTIGHVSDDGWNIIEQGTPEMPGDSRGAFGSASVTAQAKSDSRFVMDNEAMLTSPGGVFRGRVSEVSVETLDVRLSLVGPLQFLNVDKTVPPVWATNEAIPAFGVLGSGTGQFGTPYSIATDPVDGAIYVTSGGSYLGVSRIRVIKFNSAGAYVTEWGSSGSGNGQFEATRGPTYVAVAPDQSVYVSDPGNFRVQKFNSSGTYVTKWGSSGTGDGQFSNFGPFGLAVASDGSVFVSDGARRVQKFNSSGTYQAQVATPGTAPTISPWGLAIDSSNTLYVAVPAANGGTTGVVCVYNSSLVLQRSFEVIDPFKLKVGGYFSLTVDGDDNLWAYPDDSNFIVRLDPQGVEIERVYSRYSYATAGSAEYTPAFNLVTGDLHVLSGETADRPFFPAADPRVQSFHYAPVTLSGALQMYMEACDPLLNGYTLDYQGAVDPEVVFPGWSGNVWAKVKELCATYCVETVRDDAAEMIIIRDIGSSTATITNFGANGPTTDPVNLTGGRVVDVIYQQPRAGGGVVWDAYLENVRLSIAAGARDAKVLYTVNHPVELAQPVPTDTLPIQPGQYYVVDSLGVQVPAAAWLAAGGNITLGVGDSPGTISATFIGPSAAIPGFTGPFYFATGITATDTPALSIVGNGTFCTPARLVRSNSQGNPYSSPFMDTKDRALERGHAPSRSDPNVVISFTCPVSELPPMGQAAGTIFPFEQSRYRITEVAWGNLTARVTAERYVTADDWTDTWSGEAASVYEAYWPDQGYSAGDEQVQPLRHA